MPQGTWQCAMAIEAVIISAKTAVKKRVMSKTHVKVERLKLWNGSNAIAKIIDSRNDLRASQTASEMTVHEENSLKPDAGDSPTGYYTWDLTGQGGLSRDTGINRRGLPLVLCGLSGIAFWVHAASSSVWRV